MSTLEYAGLGGNRGGFWIAECPLGRTDTTTCWDCSLSGLLANYRRITKHSPLVERLHQMLERDLAGCMKSYFF